MSEINRYVIVDEDDHEEDFEYDTLQEAQEAAQRRHPERLAVIMRTYVYDDSELVWSSTGQDTWPPKEEEEVEAEEE